MIAPADPDAVAEPPVSVDEWMVATGRSRRNVYEMLADGTLPCYQTPHGRITPRAWFRRWQRGEWIPEHANHHRPARQSFVHRREV